MVVSRISGLIKKILTRIMRKKSERALKTKTAKVLPKTASEIQNGGVYFQRIRCGKTSCKCARGDTHTAFYFFTRRNGKLVKTYVRKADVHAFAVMINQANAERAGKRRSVNESNKLLRRLRESVRECEILTKLYKENYENEQG